MDFLSPAIGALSGVFAGIGANRRQKQALAWQSKENEIARNYNAEQAQLAFERQSRFNERMYDKNNAYNTPFAQSQRLAAAGLNKDLIYGNGVGGLVSSSMPSSSSPTASTSPSDMGSLVSSTPTLGESIMSGILAAKTIAEIRNIEADTSKKNGELTSIDLNNIKEAATQGSQIELANMQVNLSKSVLDLNEKQLDVLSQELNNLKTVNDQLNADIVEKMSRAAQNESSTLLNRLNALFAGPRFENECKDLAARLRESDSRISLNKQQVERMVIMTMAEKMNVDSDTLLKRAGYHNLNAKTETEYYQQDLIKIEGKNLKFDLEQKQSFDSVERSMKMMNETLHSVSHLIDAVSPF